MPNGHDWEETAEDQRIISEQAAEIERLRGTIQLAASKVWRKGINGARCRYCNMNPEMQVEHADFCIAPKLLAALGESE